jgi:hypothetical protein
MSDSAPNFRVIGGSLYYFEGGKQTSSDTHQPSLIGSIILMSNCSDGSPLLNPQPFAVWPPILCCLNYNPLLFSMPVFVTILWLHECWIHHKLGGAVGLLSGTMVLTSISWDICAEKSMVKLYIHHYIYTSSYTSIYIYIIIYIVTYIIIYIIVSIYIYMVTPPYDPPTWCLYGYV